MTQPRAPLADRLRAVPDQKARGRLRVAEAVDAHRTAGLAWTGANGWVFLLDAPPDVHLSAKDSQRVAARFDLTVRDGARVVFRDRILAWDGTPVMVRDETGALREDPVLAARMDIEHTVRVVTKDGSVPHVKAKPGTVSTFYATDPGGDGYVRSANATYATARTGGTLLAGANHPVGQSNAGGVYYCREAFVIFDTSALGDSDTVSAVTASFDGLSDSSETDLTVKLAADDYAGGAVVTTDWLSGASLSALTVLATWSSAGYSAAYNDFTETADFKTAINKTGSTSLILFSDRHAASTAPGAETAEYVVFTDADAAGTTTDPKLVVTHAAAATSAFKRALLGVGV